VQGQESKDHDYTNILPGILGRVAITDDLILNAAWTNTISRPLWDQTRYARVTDDDGDVEVGNPELDPYESMNWDLTLAYYIRPVGVVSAGVFYKNIDNFIYPLTVEEDDYDLTTWHNGGDGDILGLELAYQQKLTFLPSPLDGLSLLANITISDSSADVPASEDVEERTVDLVRHSGTVGSVALSYEKYGFFIRLSGTYRTSYLDELGEEPSEDRYIDDHFQVDLSSSYDITEHFTIYAQLLNLTNEPLKAYWGESGRLSQYEEYGMAARAGVKFTF
jgi:TonB-dependent receptor